MQYHLRNVNLETARQVPRCLDYYSLLDSKLISFIKDTRKSRQAEKALYYVSLPLIKKHNASFITKNTIYNSLVTIHIHTLGLFTLISE